MTFPSNANVTMFNCEPIISLALCHTDTCNVITKWMKRLCWNEMSYSRSCLISTAYRWTINFQLNWKRNRNLIMTLFSLTINISILCHQQKKNSLFAKLKHVYMRSDACVSALIRACAFAWDIISYRDGWISDFLLLTDHAAYNHRTHCHMLYFVFDYQLCSGGQKIHITTEYFESTKIQCWVNSSELVLCSV